MIDFRPVLQIVGAILCLLAAAMVVPAVADLAAGHDEWRVFVAAGGVTLFAGLALMLGARSEIREMTVRQIYLTSALGWFAPCVFAALPLAFGPAQLSPVDAFFEATSGLTTTGTTVLSGLDALPPGLLLWRGMLHWMGGLGIIVVALAVLPRLNIGGMQLFRMEMLAAHDRISLRAARVATTILAVYIGLTVTVALALWAAGMPRFDALVHAMSTVSTGGFSSHDSSLAYFSNPLVDLIVLVGMIMGGLPFLMFFIAAQGHWRSIARDQQVRWYFGLMGLAAVAVSAWLAADRNFEPLAALRHGTFTVVSVMTGTGLSTVDFSDWTGLAATVLLFLAFVGGCAGSTSGGIKVFRLQLLFTNARLQMRQLLRPHGVSISTFNDKPISEETLESVMGFLFVFLLAFAVLSILLGMLGMDFLSAISGAAAAISNLGVGLGGTVGPGSSLAPLPDAAKLLLAGGMLFGRLEMFVLLVLCVPSFWRQ
jgi:Trk-type K+ transport systems, membrane components